MSNEKKGNLKYNEYIFVTKCNINQNNNSSETLENNIIN